MKIGELSRRAQVSTDTLRLYEKRGLIGSQRRANGYRDFDPSMVRIVGLIRLGQRLGFKLAEMKGIVDAMAGQDLSTAETASILREKLATVDDKIAELVALRAILETLAAQACPLEA